MAAGPNKVVNQNAKRQGRAPAPSAAAGNGVREERMNGGGAAQSCKLKRKASSAVQGAVALAGSRGGALAGTGAEPQRSSRQSLVRRVSDDPGAAQ